MSPQAPRSGLLLTGRDSLRPVPALCPRRRAPAPPVPSPHVPALPSRCRGRRSGARAEAMTALGPRGSAFKGANGRGARRPANQLSPPCPLRPIGAPDAGHAHCRLAGGRGRRRACAGRERGRERGAVRGSLTLRGTRSVCAGLRADRGAERCRRVPCRLRSRSAAGWCPARRPGAAGTRRWRRCSSRCASRRAPAPRTCAAACGAGTSPWPWAGRSCCRYRGQPGQRVRPVRRVGRGAPGGHGLSWVIKYLRSPSTA